MKGCQCQVQRITTRIGGHHLVPDVRLHDLADGRLNGHQRQVMNEDLPLRTALRYIANQFIQYGRAGDQFVSLRGVGPPLPRPLPPCDDSGAVRLSA